MSDTLQHALEEQAVDYVFGHLDEAGRVEFVRAMERDSELIQLVAELSAAAAALSLSQAQSEVPPQVRDRLMQRLPSIVQERGVGVVAASSQARKPLNITSLIGWGMAACFLFYTVARTGSHYAELQRAQEQLAAQQQRSNAAIAEMKKEVEAQRVTADIVTDALATARKSVEAAKAQIKQVADQSRQLMAQKDAELAKVLAERDQFAASAKLANMQIATLQATIDDYKQGVAVVVWNAQKKEGLLKLERMPAIPANKDFQLWVVDPAYKTPVDGGIIKVDDKGFARVEFKPQLDVKSADKFAISVEKKGGVPVAEGPIVLLSN
jgi:anti-sigma-K factor RskA